MMVRCGQLQARCTCNDSFRQYCCVESIVFSMLYNPGLEVPSTKRGTLVKEKTKMPVTPWNAANVREREAARAKAKEKVPECVWAPTIPQASREVRHAKNISSFKLLAVLMLNPAAEASTSRCRWGCGRVGCG